MGDHSEVPLSLPVKYVGIPLSALGHASRKKLSLYLNIEGILIDEVQCESNFRGLAQLAGFDYLEISNFELRPSPTEEMLHEWTVRTELSPTVDRLWHFLNQLERYDVLTDCQPYIFKDCDMYLEKKSRFSTVSNPIQENEVSQSTDKRSPSTEVMTVGDVAQGKPTMYDAFVCYNPEGPDLEFVMEMIRKLEGEYKMKLFVPERDDLPGMANSTTEAKLIQHRCKRMLIILSPRFLNSESCDFQTKFAQSLSPGARKTKLIPILIERCKIPEILHFVTLVDYTKKDLMQWFWSRIASSLQAPLDRQEIDSQTSVSSGCSSSSSDYLSSIETSSSSASSLSLSSRPGNIKIRSESPNLKTSEEDGFIKVERAETQQRSATPPQLPSTLNRAPLNRPGSNTPPPNPKANTAPKQKKGFINSIFHSSGQKKGSLTPPLNRPLPKIPTEDKDSKNQKGQTVYYC